MLSTALVAFTAFFATIGPADVALLFAALTPKASAGERRVMALRGTAVAGGILLFFALLGSAVLDHLGISLAALRTAGGVLLFLIAVDLVFARPSGGITTTADENVEAAAKADVSVFPLATPLIAGPGAIGATLLLTTEARGDALAYAAVLLALAAALAVTLICLLAASQLEKLLGVTGIHVISRIVGILLAALAVQFVFDGIAASGLLATAGWIADGFYET